MASAPPQGAFRASLCLVARHPWAGLLKPSTIGATLAGEELSRSAAAGIDQHANVGARRRRRRGSDMGHDMMLEPGLQAVAERMIQWLGHRGL